jgi:hypothetical protein
VGQDGLPAVILADAEHQRRHQGGHAGVDVHDGAAREVEDAAAHEPAAAPDPMRDRRVHEERPQRDEREIRSEPHPLDHGPRDQGCGDDGKGALVRHEEDVGDRPLRLDPDATQEQVRHPTEERVSFGEGETIGGERPYDAHQAQGGEAHHHGIERVLGPDQTAVEEREGRCHQQHQRGGHQHPGGIGRYHGRRSILEREQEGGSGHHLSDPEA